MAYCLWRAYLLVCFAVGQFCGSTLATLPDEGFVTYFARSLVRTQEVVLFACDTRDAFRVTSSLHEANQRVHVISSGANFTLRSVLTRKNHAKTCIIVDCTCAAAQALLREASTGRFFNKTYQWLLFDDANTGLAKLLPPELDYVGPNAQVTYTNGTNEAYCLWDVHSKGRHLNSSLVVTLIGEWRRDEQTFTMQQDVFELQGIHHRDRFNGLTLRGASVIDQDNITTNAQIEEILSRPTKDAGVAAFGKYHYELLGILREHFNFTVNFRNARGWAGRLGNTRFRLGFLGIVMRNEADVGASGAFNRINRFAEFDIIHQSWKFETAFLYRFTPDLDAQSKSGNFLAPFDEQVWLFAIGTLVAVNVIWRAVEWISEQWRLGQRWRRSLQAEQCWPNTESASAARGRARNEISFTAVSLKTFSAVCQQGMDPIPSGLPSRTIVMTVFLYSVVMYNYYTSSVVGGLLSSTVKGPSTVGEVVSSPLKLSFEDIGYYKVLFRENKSPLITSLLNRKLLPPRDPSDLPVYTHIEDAILYLKKGHVAFHCEVADAYSEIAKHFDANEICDLRVVPGLMETEIMNWVIMKNSQYTEIFRIVMCRAREVGLIERILRKRQTRKPRCQSLYTVYPVTIQGVLSAYIILLGSTDIHRS